VKLTLAHSTGHDMTRIVARGICALLLGIPAGAQESAPETPSDTLIAPPGTAAAESPAPIAHPTKAFCRVCETKGKDHGKEDVAAWRTHEGVTYYFCSEECAAEFDANPAGYATPRFPRPAPAAVVRTLDGEIVPLESLRGNVTLVDFWATWCKPCATAMPKIQKLHDRLGARGFRAVGISIDEHGDLLVHEFVEKNKLTYPIVVDDESAPAWEAFRVVTIPATFLIDHEGQIVTQWTGEADWKEVDVAVKAQLDRVPR
jgi:peroxiredoxin